MRLINSGKEGALQSSRAGLAHRRLSVRVWSSWALKREVHDRCAKNRLQLPGLFWGIEICLLRSDDLDPQVLEASPLFGLA